MVVSLQTHAQQFGLSVTPSSSSILVSNSVTYTLNITNVGVSLGDAVVTNILPVSAQFVGATPGYVQISSNVIAFDLGTFGSSNFVQLTVVAEPTAVGFITNTVSVASTDFGLTNITSTNTVVQVTNLVILADLGVAMTGPNQPVITNDLMTYGVALTNAGPGDAPGVILTNTLPAGVLLLGVSPASFAYSLAGSNMIFNLGTLANGGFASLQFTVEPTNAGSLLLSASVGSAGVLDTNTTNNFASNNVTVIGYLPGLLVAFTNSAQAYNPQNGLVEQSITVTNAGTNGVPAVRVVIAGLTNRLYNAVGTNGGNPFVYYSAALNTNQSVNLLLQYSASAYFPFTNGQLNALAVPLPSWAPPVITATSTNLNISRLVQLANGNMLIEFPSTLGRTYTVVYSDNVSFSNAAIAPPSIVAPANRTQWIDYGPPTTRSVPTNAARFYRVYQNP